MSTIIWIIVAIAVVAIVIYLLKDKTFKKKEEGPTTPPSTPPTEGPTI